MALLAGGGLKVGQVIGSTDSTASVPKDYPVHYRDVLATVYHRLGIDAHGFVPDVTGRPVPIMPTEARAIDKLF
jgi:hypothetical protein